MSNIENLSPGDYITQVYNKYRPEQFIPNAIEVQHIEAIEPIPCIPMKVVAINTPYVLCERMVKQKGPALMDSRFTTWTKLTEEFVREFCRLHEIDIPEDAKTEEDVKEEQEASKRLCPLCTKYMSERRDGKGKWHLCCNVCKRQYIPIK